MTSVLGVEHSRRATGQLTLPRPLRLCRIVPQHAIHVSRRIGGGLRYARTDASATVSPRVRPLGNGIRRRPVPPQQPTARGVQHQPLTMPKAMAVSRNPKNSNPQDAATTIGVRPSYGSEPPGRTSSSQSPPEIAAIRSAPPRTSTARPPWHQPSASDAATKVSEGARIQSC
jgi:hypothetical protein